MNKLIIRYILFFPFNYIIMKINITVLRTFFQFTHNL